MFVCFILSYLFCYFNTQLFYAYISVRTIIVVGFVCLFVCFYFFIYFFIYCCFCFVVLFLLFYLFFFFLGGGSFKNKIAR